jgi:hypothetical protein
MAEERKISYFRSGDYVMIWDWSESNSEECLVMTGPSYTPCKRAGNVWLDSPIFDETGCYHQDSFGGDFGSSLGDFDLLDYRKSETASCIKHTEEAYRSVTADIEAKGALRNSQP